MPLPIPISELFTGRTVEWERVEFKSAWNPEAVLRTLCAFANDFNNWGGGYLVIGVAENNGRPVLPPVGLTPEAVDKAQRELIELGNKIKPTFHPIVEPTTVQGKLVMIIWAPGGDQRPYKAPVSLAKDNREYAQYIRRNSSTIVAKGEDEQELMRLAHKIPFDDRVNMRASVGDLGLGLMQGFLARVKSELATTATKRPVEDLARDMHLLGGPAEAMRPLNVALMFFASEPTRWFPGARIEVSIHPEGLAGRTHEEKIFKGPLDSQLIDALAYLRARCVTEYVQKHSDRAEATRYWSIPYEALEESLVNAVYHRDYDDREPIEVRVLPDEVVIQSFPGPDRSVGLADLRRGKAVSRRYRNRRIGEFLKELELSEGRNTGIPTILRVMKANGSPAPEFNTDEDRTYFQTKLPLRKAPKAAEVNDWRELLGDPKVDPNADPKVAGPLRKSFAIGLLSECVDAPKSTAELQSLVTVKDRGTFLSNYLKPLVEKGWIEPTIPDKPKSPAQRYRITDDGVDWLLAAKSGH